MNKVLKYLAIALAFVIISSGVLVATCLDLYEADKTAFFCALIPMTLLFMCGVIVNERLSVPRLLLRGRYLAYCITTFLIAYVIILLALGFEYLGRTWYGLPQRINDYTSKWIFVDCMGNCMLVCMMFLGLGSWQLFILWQKQLSSEKRITENLTIYLKEIKNRLNPCYILSRISFIREILSKNVDDAVAAIHELSDYLRGQLYELPEPPRTNTKSGEMMDFSIFSDFLVGDKWRVWRHLIFQSILLLIVFDVFFDAPDRPHFTSDRFIAMLTELALLDALAYVDILILYRNFRQNRNLRKYLRNVAVMILAVLIPMIVLQILTYKPTIYTYHTPIIISILAALSSMMTMTLFVTGVTAALLLQDWITGQQRVTLLHAETARQEYAFLKKQINPHFLFNVLNNAGILSVEEPQEAADMLAELQKLVEYQFAETDSNNTSLSREIDFLNSYLALESTRIEPFDYEIISETESHDIVVPTLLFIPFVENAVKHSSVVEGRRMVKVIFRKSGERLDFYCENSYKPREVTSGRPGGLGISNTLRRLNLLYGDNYTYTRHISHSLYTVNLSLPTPS